MSQVFGPVPSRRLGYSLGVDLVPMKTCTLDCVYCQVGRTNCKTCERKEWIERNRVLADIAAVLAANPRLDYITFSGSGEPTLNTGLHSLIREVKDKYNAPVAVLTNGTLLSDPQVRSALMAADLVVPSVDAASEGIFQKINAPHEDISLHTMIEGMTLFTHAFSGDIWLEVMIVKGYNDTPDEIQNIHAAVRNMRFDRIHLNTVTRPPQQAQVLPADASVLDYALKTFGDRAELIAEFDKSSLDGSQENLAQRIYEMIVRRPCSLKQISASLGVHDAPVVKLLGMMLSENRIEQISHGDDIYYRAR